MVNVRNTLIFIVCFAFLLLVASMLKVSQILQPRPRPLVLVEWSSKFESNASKSIHIKDHKNFTQSLENFSWTNFSLAIDKENTEEIWKHASDLISLLTPFLLKEPRTAINKSCISPPKMKQICKNGKTPEPRKIGFLMQFGFDVDILEIHLNELFDVVDRFFIIESTHTHSILYRKPLMWELVKDQPRFLKFLPKIVHFVVDDAPVVGTRVNSSTNSVINFKLEDLQESLLWKKFLEWNNACRFFSETDLLGFGDCDEVANRDTVNYLKHCILESDPIDVGIWFPFGAIDQAFLTDFPLNEHPFTLGDPTFWTLKTAMDIKIVKKFNSKGFPTRNRGKSEGHVLGGVHLTHYGYLPSLLIKRLAQSEGSYNHLRQVANFPEHLKTKSLDQVQKFYSEDYYKDLKYRIFDMKRVKEIDEERDKFVILPWFYNCNRDRYPAWERKSDSRLY